MLVSEQWPRFILPIIRKEWLEHLTAVSSPLQNFYGVQSSLSAEEYSQGIGGFGLVDEYNAFTANGEPGAIHYDNFSPLFESTFVHKEYAKGVAIERKLMDDNQSNLILRRAQTLGYSFGATIATHQTSVLNNAFTAVGADGKTLCATDHPSNVSKKLSWGNKGTSALSYDAIVSTLVAGQNTKDDRGTPMPVVYDTLYVPVALQSIAYEIVNAMGKPKSADNDANALYHMAGAPLSVVVDPYLTSTTNWFMLSSALARLHLLWFWRVQPEITLDPASDYNLVARYRGYARYSFGWDDARFVYGHAV